MPQLIALAVLSMAFLTGCGEGHAGGVEPVAGGEAAVTLAPTSGYSKRELEEWHDAVMDDSANWKRSVKSLEPATGYGVVTMTTVDVEAGRVVIGVNCESSVEPVKRAILDRVGTLGVPGDAVDVTVFGRATPSILGFNRLEECRPLHPAGFGGYFLKEDKSFYVYLLHPSQEAAEEVMAYQVGPNFPLEEWSVHPLQGEFTFADLTGWYARFTADHRRLRQAGESSAYLELVNVPGSAHEGHLHLTYAGVYPEKNRILFRIKPGPDAATVRQVLEERLVALNVPSEAVVIDVQPAAP